MTDDLFMIAFAIALASVPYLLVRLLSESVRNFVSMG